MGNKSVKSESAVYKNKHKSGGQDELLCYSFLSLRLRSSFTKQASSHCCPDNFILGRNIGKIIQSHLKIKKRNYEFTQF